MTILRRFNMLRAWEFAEAAHTGQVRKYTYEPYITHPVAVATNFADNFSEDICGGPEEFSAAVQAAFLHDTVEDTSTTIDDIAAKFGALVAEYVWFLTKTPACVGNRELRKKLDRKRLQFAPAPVRLIKILDVMHNATSIAKHDLEFSVTFYIETAALFDAIDANRLMLSARNTSPMSEQIYNQFLDFTKQLPV
jgi:(p)ppGpp synthase/HD superfamily hydrolase